MTCSSGPIILNHALGLFEEWIFNEQARDNVCEPYIKLRDRCVELGYRFEGTREQPLENCRWILFWDAWAIRPSFGLARVLYDLRQWKRRGPKRDIFREAQRKGLQDRMVLCMWEPPSVCPQNFDPELHKQFAMVLTWDPQLIDGKRYRRIFLPVSTGFPPPRDVPFAARKLLVDISSYKFNSHERGLSDFRMEAVRYFQTHHPNDFDLYGEGWNPRLFEFLFRWALNRKIRWEHFPSYRGMAPNKSDVFPLYKFALCYENIRDQAGYVSMKIFDCLRGGAVPVYLGAQDITDYVDPAAFIDRRKFGSNRELATYLVQMSEAEFEGYLSAAKSYLASEKFGKLLSEPFVETMVDVLKLAPVEAR